MIYLDNAATTPPNAEVVDTFQKACKDFWANPHSLHLLGERAESLLEQARSQITATLGGTGYRTVFTSGATESNNLAIKGVAEMYAGRGKHIITTDSEHPSVASTCSWLEQSGYRITRLPAGSQGAVSAEAVSEALTPQTVLVTTILINNESGAITPAAEIAHALAAHPALYHVDAVQAVGKVPVDMAALGVDMLSLSAHKFGGLKGSGALLLPERRELVPQLHGGGQEAGLRSGTTDVPAAAALAKALRLATADVPGNLATATVLNQQLREMLQAQEGVLFNAPPCASPFILSISVDGIRPESLIHALSEQKVYLSTVSACSSRKVTRSEVVFALTGDERRAANALRISLSPDTTADEVGTFGEIFSQTLRSIR